MAKFVPPKVQISESGWGPAATVDRFSDMPYQPFSKGDRIGKVAELSAREGAFQDRRYGNKYNSQFGGGSQYAYLHEEDEDSFKLVVQPKVPKPMFRGRYQRNFRQRQQQLLQRGQAADTRVMTKGEKTRDANRQRQVRRLQKQFGNRQRFDYNRYQMKNRDASVTVRPDWVVIEEMDFPRLQKLSLPSVGEPVDLYKCGAVKYYNRLVDRINVKRPEVLERIDRIHHKVTTTDDPIIRKLAKSGGNVFATDEILATLMCCTRSNYSWDIVVQKIGNLIFFDKRDESEFDLVTVSETSRDPPNDEGPSINSPRNLAMEATFINHNFPEQVLLNDYKRQEFEHPNPFVEEEDDPESIASVAYRYRQFSLGDDVELVVRTEHDAAVYGAEGQFMTIRALNEWDPKHANNVDWRQKLDTQRAAVLANELKNNNCKMAKWTVQSLLAGSGIIKFGFVSRVAPRDSSKHVILNVMHFKPSEFATQINLSMDNAWGILRCIVDIIRAREPGKYLIMKDPNKQMVNLYDIPDDTFETDEDEEDSDEGVEEEDD
ncbi:LOW QUALITY PROTEIN: eukaryotic translation initiation factor 3 subunit D-like [Pollicipes pollicipes]|uniref:eukaryotic translation initiation factor 3 subunit D-like n=1 Tax=Pollicipes pollicipes TaxID=41117 RepID=UPI0018856DC5|nr:eukaryotic translation initiation factor 3 subunit D-like [Pollicipes pollicipes]XP_037070849.1 LOW QUALITY PROTEIN: eukaryotic translation initiation factor 3 subunit D-like [Pollicipes pollicipes]